MNSTAWNSPAGSVASLLVAAAAIFAAARVSAAAIAWTNTAGGNWIVAANWSPCQLPGSNDVAQITTPGTYTVTLNTGPTIAGSLVGGASGTQTLSQAATTSQIPIINSGRVEMLSGTLFASAGFTNQSGNVSLKGGELRLPASGTLDLQGGALAGYGLLGAHLLNSGEVLPATNGTLVMGGKRATS